MANRSFLMAHESATPVVAAQHEDKIVAAASYQVPLLWLALYSIADLESVDMMLEDDQGNASVGPVPTLHTSREAYASEETGRSEIYVRPFPNVDEGLWQVSTNGGAEAAWAH